MDPFPIVVDLGLVMTGAALLFFLTRPLRVPPILAYMVAGLLLGPATGVLAVSDSVELFSELGIALLLFLVGLELSLARLRDVGRTAVVAGTLQVALTTALGAGLALLLGFDRGDAVVIGLAVAFSSTVVVVKLLDRAGAITSLHGRLAIGILLVQDVIVAVALTLLSGLGADGADGGGAIFGGIARAGIGIATLGALAWAGVRWLLPPLLGWMADSGESLFVVGLTWCFGFILLAEAFHVSIELGAFVAGIGLAQLPYGHELQRRVHSLVGFFLAVFFVSLGVGMDIGALPRLWLPTLALTLFVLLVKPALIALLLARGRSAGRPGFLAGVTLGQISEFGFILVALAGGAGMIASPDLQPLIGLVGLSTFGASAFLVPRAPALFRLVRPLLPGGLAGPPDRPLAEEALAGPRGHVVVVGMNSLGRDLVHQLAERGARVVAVDTDPAKLHDLPAATIFGNVDSPTVLEESGVPRARLVVSALQIEDVNALLAYRCRTLDVPVSIHAFDPSLVDELLEIGADHLIVSKVEGSVLVKAELERLGVLGAA